MNHNTSISIRNSETSNLFPNTCILKSSLVMIGTRSPRCLISASLNGILKNSAQGKTWLSVVQEFECTDRSNNLFQRKISVVNNFFCSSVALSMVETGYIQYSQVTFTGNTPKGWLQYKVCC